MAGEGKGYDGENNEIGSSGEICEYWVSCEMNEQSLGNPPVSLSNLSVKAMAKKKSWYPMVMRIVMAR